MTIKEFIEKAIEGGWTNTDKFYGKYTSLKSFNKYWAVINLEKETTVDAPELGDCAVKKVPISSSIRLSEIWIDPKAWEAVGKVDIEKCWACDGKKFFTKFASSELDKEAPCGNCKSTGIQQGNWKNKMHRMIDALVEGKSIEQFLSEL